jgi:hypothetical protein
MAFLIFIFSLIAAIVFAICVFFTFDKYNNFGYKVVKGNSIIIIISLFLFSICSLFLAVVLNHTYEFINVENNDYTKVGAYGDLIGGILNPVVAFIGIIAASLAFYAQYRANAQVQKQFRIQQFESQFYEMVRLHKENVNEMKITGYDLSIQESINYDISGQVTGNKTVTKSRAIKFTEARKVFVTMHTELIAIYELLESYDEKYFTGISKEALLKLAYQIFFYGVKSDLPSSDEIEDNIIGIYKRHLNNIRNRHRDSNGSINVFEGVNMKNIGLHIKYSPFTGHESRLGHYYRHLYGTVKFVTTNDGKLFSYSEVRSYLKILRSQMSNDEQLMLYYNCIIGFGRDWELKGYLTKYRMIHNLPVDKVKYVKHPRVYFKNYIDSLSNGDDPLFEWGDHN